MPFCKHSETNCWLSKWPFPYEINTSFLDKTTIVLYQQNNTGAKPTNLNNGIQSQ
jgi:hypothetical protein